MRRYAEDTTVPVAKSRAEIDKLLRDWRCDQLQWSDDYKRGRAQLRFVWEHEGHNYLARFNVQMPDEVALKKDAIDGRNGCFSERKFQVLLDARGKHEHRVLLLWLKAALNAVEAGIVSAEAIFLAFLEGADGVTVAERAIPRLESLTEGSAERLLPAPGGR